MRWNVMLLLSVIVVAMIAAPGLVQAQAEPILYPPAVPQVRQVDWSFSPCNNSSVRCLARAVADFNGDGIDDLLLEQAPLTAGQSRSGANVSGGTRALSLFLGPLAKDNGQMVDSAAIVEVDPPGNVADLSVVDVDGDGLQDMVFTGFARTTRVEKQHVAVLFGRTSWPSITKLGSASRGDLLVEREVPLDYNHARLGQRLAATFADVNGDGHLDLLLASDPPAGSDGRGAPDSEVAVMLGGEIWPWRSEFRTDVTVSGLGRCGHGLGGVADVTGDGVADIVVRQCAGNGLPDQPFVLPGRPDWPAQITLPGAPDPAIVPPPGTPVPHPTRAAPPGRGYVVGSGGDRGFGPFDPGPMLILADLNGDGVRDLALDQGGRTHVFAGGPDVADRVAAGKSSGILLNASLGAVPLSRGWRPLAPTGEAGGALLLGQQDPVLSARNGRDRMPSNDALALMAVSLFAGGLADAPVLDAAGPGDATLRLQRGTTLWGMGDLNGDGAQDLLLGSSPTAGPVRYQVVLGPFERGETSIQNRR